MEHFHRTRLRHSLVFVFSDETEITDIRTVRALAHENDLIFVTVLDSFERTGAAHGAHHAVGPDGDVFISTRHAAARERFASERSAKLLTLSRTLRAA